LPVAAKYVPSGKKARTKEKKAASDIRMKEESSRIEQGLQASPSAKKRGKPPGVGKRGARGLQVKEIIHLEHYEKGTPDLQASRRTPTFFSSESKNVPRVARCLEERKWLETHLKGKRPPRDRSRILKWKLISQLRGKTTSEKKRLTVAGKQCQVREERE